MHNKSTVIILLALVLLWSISGFAQDKVGSSSAKFLALEVGARSTSMGSAVSALTDMGALSVFCNPAGISYVEGMAASFNYTDWIADIGHNAASFAMSVGNLGTFGIGAVTMGSGDIDETIALPPYKTGNTYSVTDIAIGLSFARAFTDRFSVGATVKYVSEKIQDQTATGVALDIGTLYEIGVKNFVLGASMKNFGSALKYSDDTGLEWPMPMMMCVGVSGEPVELGIGKLITGFEMTKVRDYKEVYAVGLEYWPVEIFALRGGYKLNYDEEEGFSAGAGFRWPDGKFKLSADYSYTDFGVFDYVHRASLNIGF